MLILQVFPLLEYLTIPTIIGLIVIAWNASRNYTNMQNELKNLGITATKELGRLDTKLTEIEKELIERMNKGVLNQVEKFTNLQKQIDNMKVELKDVHNRVTQVDTKVNGQQDWLQNTNNRIDKNIDFFTVWGQRKEDRIEKAQDRLFTIVSDAKRELMGVMNMLINYGASQTGLKK